MIVADLLAAIDGGDDTSVDLLIGATPGLADARNEEGVSATMHPLYRRRPEIAERLADALPALDVEVGQRHGWTPLQDAAQNGSLASVERLLAAGADPAAANDDSTTALDLARAAGHEAIAARLG